MEIKAPPIPRALAPEPTGLNEDGISTICRGSSAASAGDILPTENKTRNRKIIMEVDRFFTS
jgi:hypothetical protein